MSEPRFVLGIRFKDYKKKKKQNPNPTNIPFISGIKKNKDKKMMINC